MDQIVTIIRRHWLPLLGLNSVLLAVTIYAATAYADKTSPPVWTASAKLNLPQTSGDLNADLGTLGSIQNGGVGFSKELNPLQIQSTILTSDVVLEQVRAVDPERDLFPGLGSYRKLFEVTPQEQSTTISLEAEASSPDLAHKRVATLIEVYQQRLNELRRSDAAVRTQFAQEDLKDARNNLNRAQTALAKFQQSSGLTDVNEQTKGLVEAINSLRTSQASVLAEARANETQAKVAASRLRTTPQRAMDSLRLAENKEYQAIRDKVSQVETALAEARGKFTEQSPQVQALLLQRQELQRDLNRRLATAIPGAKPGSVDTTLGGGESKDSRLDMITELVRAQSTAKGLEQQAGQLQSQVDKLKGELNFISKNQVQLADLQRQFEIAEGVYKGIIAQIEQAKTSPFNAYPNVQTLDEPTVNPTPEEPKRWLIVLGGMFASFFGSTALVLFLESRKPLLSPKDLQQVDHPVLVSISRLKRRNVGWDLDTNAEVEFQRLAAVVSSLMLENRRLMVTSATFGEGKTTVTLGLAVALVKLGYRVLVVDGDLRQAEMSRRLGYAREAKSHSSPVPVYPGLDLMPAPAIPKDKIAEFFARGSFEQDLNVVQDSGSYDYVLLDSAPVSLTIDPTLMSAVVPNVLFVVRHGISDRYSVIDSFEQLSRHGARITGLVVNGVESRTDGYRYGRQRELLEAEA